MKTFFIVTTLFLQLFFSELAPAADVQLGPGDVIKISVYGNPDLSLETRISEAGNITFPLVGEVTIGGLATADAEKKISELLEKGGFIRKAQVNLIVTQLQSQQLSVLGQVNRPGRYPVDGRRNIADILALAGGVSTDGGDFITIIRVRDGKTTKELIDFVELMKSGDTKKNIELMSGDIIYVDRAPRFYIYGEVQRPGTFRLERNMTVVQALSVGGGLTPRGTERGMVIKRRNEKGGVDVLHPQPTDLLQADDVLQISESLF